MPVVYISVRRSDVADHRVARRYATNGINKEVSESARKRDFGAEAKLGTGARGDWPSPGSGRLTHTELGATGPRRVASSAPCDHPRVTLPATPSPTVATRIHADREGRTLRVEWQDGHVTVHDFTALRWLCPCAYCRGEAGMPGWLDTAPTLTPEQTRLVDIVLVGNYAVAPSWGDGHHTGYYTFALLRDRCPCAECSARRSSREPAMTQEARHAKEHQP
jgi:DUF971 family protein